jgi:hypothetical protein
MGSTFPIHILDKCGVNKIIAVKRGKATKTKNEKLVLYTFLISEIFICTK